MHARKHCSEKHQGNWFYSLREASRTSAQCLSLHSHYFRLPKGLFVWGVLLGWLVGWFQGTVFLFCFDRTNCSVLFPGLKLWLPFHPRRAPGLIRCGENCFVRYTLLLYPQPEDSVEKSLYKSLLSEFEMP